MSDQTTAAPDIKAGHRVMWALGDYATVAEAVIPTLGSILVDAVGVTQGERVLDVAAGSGNASLPAAALGAKVVASDLTPQLFESGRAEATARGLAVEWREADCEDLPFGDGAFDVVISCVGVMFAPFHERSSAELLRVTRGGGRIGLLNWTPEGFIGEMFAAMKPFAPPPPPGGQPPVLWGKEEHVRGLLGDQVSDVVAVRDSIRIDCFAQATDFVNFFKRCYGPTIATYRRIAEDEDRVQALDTALADLARRHDLGGGVMDWEYLLLTARRR